MNSIAEIIEKLIKNRKTTKPILVVFKGFTRSFFSSILKVKLFDSPLDISIQELESLKASLIPQLFNKTMEKNFYWITFEEALIVGEELLKLYYNTITLRNNLFHHAYPSLYRFDINQETLDIIDDDEMEIDENQNGQLEFIYRIYGSIRKLAIVYEILLSNIKNPLIPRVPVPKT